MKPPLLVREEFKAWLESKKPRQVVGYRGHVGRCPLAVFLNEAKGMERASVSIFYGEWVSGRHPPTPKWAVNAWVAFDNSGRASGITAATALRILERIS